MKQITLAVPVAMIAAANALLGAVAYSAADALTFIGPTHLSEDGGRYAVASGVLDDEVIGRLLGGLVAPSWPVDLALAGEAQAALAFWMMPSEESAQPFSHPAHIALVIGLDAQAAREVLGVVPLAHADDPLGFV